MTRSDIERSAVIDPTGVYRYTLSREWDKSHIARCIFIMLNPSTADADQDDPTIRRCIDVAKQLGCSLVEVVNLFALRSTDPKEIWRWREGCFDPVGPENNWYLVQAASQGLFIIAAWGSWQNAVVRDRAGNVTQMLYAQRIPLHCLQKTKNGDPHHPLYLPKKVKLEVYS